MAAAASLPNMEGMTAAASILVPDIESMPAAASIPDMEGMTAAASKLVPNRYGGHDSCC